MIERFYGGNDVEFCDYAEMCMTGEGCLQGILFGYEADGNIDGCFNAEEEIIIGAIDAPDHSPAGGMQFLDNALMYGVFAMIVRRGK